MQDITGQWISVKGECAILRDESIGRLMYDEALGDTGHWLRGWLVEVEPDAWEAELAILLHQHLPWTEASDEQRPDVVGSVQVRLLPAMLTGLRNTMETRIRLSGRTEQWEPPTIFSRKVFKANAARNGAKFKRISAKEAEIVEPEFIENYDWTRLEVYEEHDIAYSEKYFDKVYEYRHVIFSREAAESLTRTYGDEQRLLTEEEWRSVGVVMSRGWVNYEMHRNEPQIMLFRRPLSTDPKTGKSFLDKLLTVHSLDAEEGQPDHLTLSFTSMAGEEVTRLGMRATDSLCDLQCALVDRLQFPSECTRLLHPDGRRLDDLARHTSLAEFLFA